MIEMCPPAIEHTCLAIVEDTSTLIRASKSYKESVYGSPDTFEEGVAMAPCGLARMISLLAQGRS